MPLPKRQKIAANTPAFIRKAVRMAEHYARRQKAWVDIFRHMSGEQFSDKLLLCVSALASPFTSLAKLDSLLAGTGRIALIKMDLEGAEYGALLGAERLLASVDTIVFENNSEDMRIYELLESHGFSIAPLDGHDYLAQRI